MLERLTGLWRSGGAGRRPRFDRLLAGFVVLAVAATACGGGGGGSSVAPSGASPNTGAAGGTPAEVSAPFMAAMSSKSFADAVAALQQSTAGAGMMVMGSFDQAKALSMTG
jgi:hypothetical protein